MPFPWTSVAAIAKTSTKITSLALIATGLGAGFVNMAYASAPQADFAVLESQLLTVDKVYMTASIQVTMNSLGTDLPVFEACCSIDNDFLSMPQTVRGSMEYIAVGDEYRLLTNFPDTIVPGMHTEVSFVNNIFTYIDHQAKLAGSTTGIDRTLTGRVFMVPIFAPYDHIRPVHPTRRDYPNLKTLQAAVLNNQTPSYTSWNYASLGVNQQVSTHVRSDSTPHPSQLNVSLPLRIFASLNELDRPSRIEERDPSSGNLRAITTISHYEEVMHDDHTLSLWPHLVVYEVFDDNETLIMTISVVVRTLLVNSEAIDSLSIAPTVPANYTVAQDGTIIYSAP